MRANPTRRELAHKFVEFIPEQLEEGVLYISVTYATAAHRCFCGCGHEVVTPLSPTDWKLVYDGEAVSLSPSIGNWSIPCRSHYWIQDGHIKWCGEMPVSTIIAGRQRDKRAKAAYYGSESGETTVPRQCQGSPLKPDGLLGRFLAWLWHG